MMGGETVKGRALERYSTMASRETVDAIKNKETRESFNLNGRVDFTLQAPNVTNNIDYLRNIIIKMRQS